MPLKLTTQTYRFRAEPHSIDRRGPGLTLAHPLEFGAKMVTSTLQKLMLQIGIVLLRVKEICSYEMSSKAGPNGTIEK